MKFSVQEYDAVLAGLRLLQWELIRGRMARAPNNSRLGMIRNIYRDSSDGLTVQEIDTLCEKING